jgi:hypothetical protein
LISEEPMFSGGREITMHDLSSQCFEAAGIYLLPLLRTVPYRKRRARVHSGLKAAKMARIEIWRG